MGHTGAATESADIRTSWRRFWRYQWLVLRETGWPPARDWAVSVVVALVTGASYRSWLPSIAYGIAAGLIFYGVDLARASARLYNRQKDQLAQLSKSTRGPWREGDTLLRRFSGLAVDFDNPSKYDLGSYRPDATWDKKFEDFENAIPDLELAASGADSPYREEYLDICQDMRDILSQPVQMPKGKFYYLALSRSRVVERLKELVARDRKAASTSSLGSGGDSSG